VPITAALLIFAATIIASLAGLYARPQLIERNLFRPYFFAQGRDRFTLITSGFMHADLAHLAMNMITFWFFAFPLEQRIGSFKFVVLYFAALALSSATTYRKHRKDPDYASLGASGAISAVLFAYIVYFPTATLFILPFPFPIPAPLFAVAYVGYSWWSGRQQKGRINHDAHLDGALSGLAFVALTDPGAYSNLIALLR